MEELLHARRRFSEIFSNKGNLGPIAEKAHRNFKIINKHPISIKERVFNFCIGHAFRNIDKDVFAHKLNEEMECLEATQYLCLQKDFFTFKDELFTLIGDVRNINSHYVHEFDKLAISNISLPILSFLREAFELASLLTFLKERNLNYQEFEENKYAKDDLKKYLCDKFFINETHQKQVRDKFLLLPFKDAIDYLLFTDVHEDMVWNIQDVHPIFTIKKGRYLSFHACLFLLSLFLYKDEANLLISKVKGFKKTEDKFHFKRDIFTFFSKKFSSQDINSEEKYLIRFRDIVQYLNHYPTYWNANLEPKRLNPTMADALEKHIIETEIFRSFPKYKDNAKRNLFLFYAVGQLFRAKKHLFDFHELSISEDDKRSFSYEINSSPRLKDIDLKLRQLNKKDLTFKERKEKETLEKKKYEEKGKSNPVKEKLLERIRTEQLMKSYGRNQDRFMEMAVRFLVEEKYFGAEAEFSLYEFYTTDEQNEGLKDKKLKLTKKEYDALKYHQGKLVHFCTYDNHLKNYPNWDNPFVIENNAFKLKITLSDGTKKLFSLQRKLLIYLLEDALYTQQETLENKGKILLEDYYLKALSVDFEAAQAVIKKQTTISAEQKSSFKRILPKRLLYHYHPAIHHIEVNYNPFIKILEDTEQQEQRYQLLHAKAKSLDLENEFVRKNKGKQFKLRFIRKAWQLMFFKDTYKQQAEEYGHHKSFHISKEEFNNFSKWMYAFDEIPAYKDYLDRLFKAKKFYLNEDFYHLFDSSVSLEELYQKTKLQFSNWIKDTIPSHQTKEKYTLTGYKDILKKDIIYINIAHFIEYLEVNGYIKRVNNIISYKALDNIRYLEKSYYYKDVLAKEEYKTAGKLYNKLKNSKLEDALLYELALRYLYVDKTIVNKAKTHIARILNSDITFDIKDGNNKHLYNLIVPFSQLESLAVLFQHKIEQENDPKNKRTSFLANINKYLLTPNQKKDIKNIAHSYNLSLQLRYEDLIKIYNHIIAGSVKFSKVEMKLEEYYILKNQLTLSPNSNFIDIDEIKDAKGNNEFKKLYKSLIRNKVYHFGMPEEEYEKTIKTIEYNFIKHEIKPLGITSFEQLSVVEKDICRFFMSMIHDNLFKKTSVFKKETLEETRKRKEKERKDFETEYFKKYILG